MLHIFFLDVCVYFFSCCTVYNIPYFNVPVCVHDGVFTAPAYQNHPVRWKCQVKCVINSTTHHQCMFIIIIIIIIKITTHIISPQHILSIVSDLQATPMYVKNYNILQIHKIIEAIINLQ